MDHLIQSIHNCFGAGFFDRMANSRGDDQIFANRIRSKRAQFIPVWRGRPLFSAENLNQPAFLNYKTSEKIIKDLWDTSILLGQKDDILYFTVGLPPDNSAIPDQFSEYGCFRSLRAVDGLTNHPSGALLVYAKGITYWHQNHQFCGKCGNITASKASGHMRQCTNEACRQQQFPRTDPAIIVLVTNGHRCLLARQPSWKPSRFSSIAGFVEPGESLEHAVIREVFEETGVGIETVMYHSSQPWPFPGSIMLGFIATANNDTIEIDGQEIEAARWFSREDINHDLRHRTLFLPPKISISYNLIEYWFNQGTLGDLGDLVPLENDW